MFQNIIKASRLRGLPSSIAIGGAATLIPNAATLAQYLTITTASIRNFRIVGDTVLANIINTYEIGATASTFENDTNIRYFNQGIGGISTGFTRYFANSSVFYLTSRTEGRVSSDEMYEDSALKYAFFENGDTLRGYKCFAGLENAKIYLGNLQFLEAIVGASNAPFRDCNNVDVYMPSSAPFIPNQGSDFNRINILNTTTPSAIDDLNAIQTGGTYIELDFTDIPAADFYEVWEFKNSVWEFIGEIKPTTKYLTSLEENTNYQFRLATCDQYWNGSGFFEDAAKQALSDTINVTTGTTPAIYQNVSTYLKLDETSGDAIDVVNGHNFIPSGGVTQGVTGKIGNAYSFDGIDGQLEAPLSIYDDYDSNNFVFSCWFQTNNNTQGQTIVSDLVGNNFFDRKLFIRLSGSNQKIEVRIGDNGTTLALDSTTTILNNTWYFLQFKYDSNGSAVLKINNNTEDSEVFVNAPTVENRILIGQSGLDTVYFNGIIDEVSFTNGQTTNATDTARYNSGNGTTI